MIDKLKKILEVLKHIPDDIGGQIQYTLRLGEYKAEISELMVEVNHQYSEHLAITTEKIREEFKGNEKGNASLMSNTVKGRMRDLQRLVELADRINSTINFQGDRLTMVLSVTKNIR